MICTRDYESLVVICNDIKILALLRSGHLKMRVLVRLAIGNTLLTLTRDVSLQISWIDFRDYGSVLERIVIVTDAINGLVASFPEPWRTY